jgi:hypothetical protein
MANHVDVNRLAEVFEQIGCGWVLKLSNHVDLLRAAAQQLDEFMVEYRREFGEEPDPFSFLDENPTKAAAFFRTFAAPRITPKMRMTIWRILKGADIIMLLLNYQRKDSRKAEDGETEIPLFESDFEITIRTKFDYQADYYECRSTHPWDYPVIRNIGLVVFGETAILTDYFAESPP